MNYSENEKVPVALGNDSVIYFEISQSGRQEVAFRDFSFDEIGSILEGVTTSLRQSIEKARPQKASVKFGLEVGIEAGKLTAAIVKGSTNTPDRITR